MTSSLSGAASAPVLPAAGVGEKLDWDAFSARYFPGRRRHDLDAVAAYGAYKHGRDWQNSGVHKAPRRLTLVPSESAPAAIAPEADGPAMERLLVAVAGERVWEGEGSFPPRRTSLRGAGSGPPVARTTRLRLGVEAVLRLQRSRLGRWTFAVGSGVVVIALVLLAARHFATTSWPLSNGQPGLLVAAGLLLLVAQALKAYGWAGFSRWTSGPRRSRSRQATAVPH